VFIIQLAASRMQILFSQSPAGCSIRLVAMLYKIPKFSIVCVWLATPKLNLHLAGGQPDANFAATLVKRGCRLLVSIYHLVDRQPVATHC
jgi:hypothetical protein